MSKQEKSQLRLRAIVTRDNDNDAVSLEKASLLRYDSIHGDFEGSVADPENNALVLMEQRFIITANGPEEIDYTLLIFIMPW
jgi:glyceraldehyde 3-phosphate dehydrogenase